MSSSAESALSFSGFINRALIEDNFTIERFVGRSRRKELYLKELEN